jgi:hypothetical protein
MLFAACLSLNKKTMNDDKKAPENAGPRTKSRLEMRDRGQKAAWKCGTEDKKTPENVGPWTKSHLEMRSPLLENSPSSPRPHCIFFVTQQ